MSSLLVVLALVVAAAAAVRSTWSPCGVSMLSTVTPLTEAGRGRRWGPTAAWFVVGAVVGGLTLGLLAALGAVLVSAAGVAATTALGIAAVAAVVALGSDLAPFGVRLPWHGRQVNERWLDQYRAWVYGAGFGWQIGVGLATYITTAAVYLTILMAALTASPAVAVGVGAFFGLVRGLAILLGARLTDPQRLLAFHRRFEAWREPVRRVTIGVEALVALVAAGVSWGAAGVVVTGLALASLVGLAVVSRRHPAVAPATPHAAPALVEHS